MDVDAPAEETAVEATDDVAPEVLPPELAAVASVAGVARVERWTDVEVEQPNELPAVARLAGEPIDAILAACPRRSTERFLPCGAANLAKLGPRLRRAMRRLEADRLVAQEKEDATMAVAAAPAAAWFDPTIFYDATNVRTDATTTGCVVAPSAGETAFDVVVARPPLRDVHGLVYAPDWLSTSRHLALANRRLRYNVQTAANSSRRHVAKKSALLLKATGISTTKLLNNSTQQPSLVTRHSGAHQQQQQQAERGTASNGPANGSHQGVPGRGDKPPSDAPRVDKQPPFDPASVTFEDVKRACPALVTA
ncbi:MAG: hypothetical protein AAFQ17_07170, partial [Pseudomonadota bacterium]